VARESVHPARRWFVRSALSVKLRHRWRSKVLQPVVAPRDRSGKRLLRAAVLLAVEAPVMQFAPSSQMDRPIPSVPRGLVSHDGIHIEAAPVSATMSAYYASRPSSSHSCAAAVPLHRARRRPLHGCVVQVVDGDTPVVHVGNERVRVRLVEIDAPEKRQPLGTPRGSPLQRSALGSSHVLGRRVRIATGACWRA